MVSSFTQNLFALLAALALWFYWRRCKRWAELLKEFKPFGSAFPLIGHFHHLLGAKRGMMERFIELAVKTGHLESRRPGVFWLSETPTIAIFRPEDFEVTLGSTKELHKPGLVYNPVRTFFGDGLITLNGNAWHHHRKVLTPTFHFTVLENYAETFKKHAKVLAKELCDPKFSCDVDIMPIVSRTVTQTICETAFGMSERLAHADELEKMYEFFDALDVSFKTVRMRIFNPWLMLLYRFTPVYTKQKKAEVIMREYATHIVKLKREEIAQDDRENIPVRDDTGARKKVAFLDLVLRDAKNLLSEEDILNEVRTLVTAQQTSASTLAFIFVMLAIHQDVQEEVLREVRELHEKSDRRPYYQQLSEMKYLERVIKETLRLYPVAPAFARKLANDTVVPSGTLPAGSICFMHVFVMQRDKRFYGPDPERFDPDHFLPDRCRDRHPYAYLPFSAGPRNCIGQKYAMMQMKAVVSTVIRHVRIFPGQGCRSQKDLHLDVDTFLHIVGGFNVRFEPRDL